MPKYFNSDFFKPSQKVKYGSFDATIVRHYYEGMWEIRVQSGIICVSGHDILA